MAITLKDAAQIEKMRIAGRLAGEVLDYITPFVLPGVTTEALDQLCHDYMVNEQGCIPAPLNYAPDGHRPYPKSICTSVNQVICHGVPNDKPLKKGDIVNLDITVIKDGFHGDTSRMFMIGEVTPQARRLVELTHRALWIGIEQVKPGGHLGDIGAAIQKFTESSGYSVVHEFCGHGIGLKFHEEPQVLHYGRAGTGVELVPGMIFTIEPMINLGTDEIFIDSDNDWTVYTEDGAPSAQWEVTVAVTEDGYEILAY